MNTTKILASVADLAEARIVLEAGVDIVDLKNPAAGALGALPVAEVAEIVAAVAEERPLSATVGDLPMLPQAVIPAVRAMAATGVDYVKIGFFPGGDWPGVLEGLRPLAAETRLVAVLFGDDAPDLAWVEKIAAAGFAGAMLDTRDKTRGSLRTLCESGYLREFVGAARAKGMLCGLAGSLRIDDVAELATLEPDYLGFRGALCGGTRTGRVERAAVEDLVGLMRDSTKIRCAAR